jgi:hypothetical protein
MDKYVPLKEVVSMFLDQSNKSIRDFDKCWVMAFRGLRLINQSFSAEPKTARLPVEGNKTVNLPSDYLALSKIGVVNGSGEIVSLRRNDALSIFRDNNPDRITKLASEYGNSDDVIIPQNIFLNYSYNGDVCHLYGAGGGLITAGDYKLDERNDVIILNTDFQYSDIVMEYICNPELDGDYYVPQCMSEAIIAFIEWKMKLNTEQHFYARVIEGRRSLPNKRATLQNIHQVLRETGGQYLKS